MKLGPLYLNQSSNAVEPSCSKASRLVEKAPLRKFLNICVFNSRSIKNKLEFLFLFVKQQSPQYDMIFITESWLNDKILDSQVCPNGYQIIRKDRTSDLLKRGGGVLLLYKNGLNVVDKTECSQTDVEHLCVDVCSEDRSEKHGSYRFICYYNPPGISKVRTGSLCNSIESYLEVMPVFIVGDFNMPGIDWQSMSSSSKADDPFLELYTDSSLRQHIHEATHDSSSILDLVLTNPIANDLLIRCDVSAPFTSTCDHNTISFHCSRPTKNSIGPKEVFCYRKGNYDAMNGVLSMISWDKLFVDNDYNVQKIYDGFLSLIHSLIECYVPKNKISHRPKHNKTLKALAKKKANLYRKYKADRSLKAEYKNLSKLYDKEVQAFHDKIEDSVCSSNNLSSFYKYTNKKLKVTSSIPPIVSEDGDLLTDNIEKADHFNNTFQSVFIQDNGTPLVIQPKTNVFMENICITDEMITVALRNLKLKTSRTPDEIPSIVLKKIGTQITYFLKNFFQLSINTGTIPKEWKTAIVSPIHKKSSKDKAKNYRPISLTSSICRLLESIIKDCIIDHIFSQNLLSGRQHGFLPGRGTTTQLLHSLNNWTTAHDLHEIMEIVYTDFSKAFDRVSHRKLLQVIQAYGIIGTNLSWINEFLSDRTQQVIIEDELSSPLDVLSGVPQGSVLGPLLFIIYIEDIQNCCEKNSKIGLYADDSKIFSTDAKSLQGTLSHLDKFIEDRQLLLAADKCQHLSISSKNISSKKQFFLENRCIAQCNVVVDLGIRISSDLKWKNHIAHLTNKSSRRCYQILHSFRTKSIWTYVKAYTTYVRPILETNTVIWSPYLKQDVKSVESIQISFLKSICRRCSIPASTYQDRLDKLGVETLEYRRWKFDLILVYKIINNLVDLKFSDFFSFFSSPYQLRRHKFFLKSFQSHYDVRKNFFSNRIVNLWNSLPESIVDAPTLITFRKKLANFNLRTVQSMIF